MSCRERKKAEPSYTVVALIEDNLIRFGVAKCSKEDNFSKAKGRNLAVKQALLSDYMNIPDYVVEKGILGTYFTTKAKKLIR